MPPPLAANAPSATSISYAYDVCDTSRASSRGVPRYSVPGLGQGAGGGVPAAGHGPPSASEAAAEEEVEARVSLPRDASARSDLTAEEKFIIHMETMAAKVRVRVRIEVRLRLRLGGRGRGRGRGQGLAYHSHGDEGGHKVRRASRASVTACKWVCGCKRGRIAHHDATRTARGPCAYRQLRPPHLTVRRVASRLTGHRLQPCWPRERTHAAPLCHTNQLARWRAVCSQARGRPRALDGRQVAAARRCSGANSMLHHPNHHGRVCSRSHAH